MDAQRLRDLLLRFPRCRVAVLGDFFLDKYLEVDPALAEISLETGKRAHQVVATRCSPGAAGTVVNNLAALGAGRIHVLGFAGDDGEGYELRRGMQALGCDVAGLIALADRSTPTYLKPRDRCRPDLTGEHERYDTKNRAPTPAAAQAEVLTRLAQLLPDLDAVIAIDQVEEPECGIVTEKVRDGLAALAGDHPATVFWADSRRRIGLFRNVAIKVNAREAVREVLGEAADPADDSLVERAVTELGRRTGRPVFVTAGRRGIWVGEPAAGSPTLVRAVEVEDPIDSTGAGDSATAGAVLALCTGSTLQESALVANLVASITIQQLATTGTAAPSQLGARLETWRGQTRGESGWNSRSTTWRT